jgi:hypothetical protein
MTSRDEARTILGGGDVDRGLEVIQTLLQNSVSGPHGPRMKEFLSELTILKARWARWLRERHGMVSAGEAEYSRLVNSLVVLLDEIERVEAAQTSGASERPKSPQEIKHIDTMDNSSNPIADNAEYLVWYGTNRRPNLELGEFYGYSSERDDRIHYGRCRVFVPRSHKIGSIGSPWWKRLLGRTDDRLKLLATEPLTFDLFLAHRSLSINVIPTQREGWDCLHSWIQCDL